MLYLGCWIGALQQSEKNVLKLGDSFPLERLFLRRGRVARHLLKKCRMILETI